MTHFSSPATLKASTFVLHRKHKCVAWRALQSPELSLQRNSNALNDPQQCSGSRAQDRWKVSFLNRQTGLGSGKGWASKGRNTGAPPQDGIVRPEEMKGWLRKGLGGFINGWDIRPRRTAQNLCQTASVSVLLDSLETSSKLRRLRPSAHRYVKGFD